VRKYRVVGRSGDSSETFTCYVFARTRREAAYLARVLLGFEEVLYVYEVEEE
jgi:hypothetical protein